MIRRTLNWTGLAALSLLGVVPTSAHADITVFAAASLAESVSEIARLFEQENGEKVTVSFAGSSTLARQISLGAPADIFISANVDWMDELENQGWLLPETRVDLLGNSLVVIAPTGSAPIEINELYAHLDGQYLAVALVDAVPAGIYTKAAFRAMGLWDEIADNVAQTDNVRAALALVATGAAPYGIVYASDALAQKRVDIVGEFPPEIHPEITYPMAQIAGQSGHDSGSDFAKFLHTAPAQEIFESRGFITLGAFN